DQPGTYVYRVLDQKSDSTADVHDKRVYLVTIYAEAESDDKLKTAVSSSDVNGDKPDLILFEDKIAGDNIPDPHPHYDPFYPHDDPGEPVVMTPKPAEDTSVPEDPSSGAPSFGDGLFIDVGTFVKMIDPPATEAEKQEIAMLEESFIGGIPVLYLVCAIVLPLIGVIVSRCSKKKE
ncbi:MAG: hypothetical protein IKR73_00090, partial [Oscillospiraceae bacterium]|nr:hypothetical protein [Oscillospiraceae bacterium]